MDELTYVVSVSEKHNMANVRRTPAESLEQFKTLIGEYGDKMNFRLRWPPRWLPLRRGDPD